MFDTTWLFPHDELLEIVTGEEPRGAYVLPGIEGERRIPQCGIERLAYPRRIEVEIRNSAWSLSFLLHHEVGIELLEGIDHSAEKDDVGVEHQEAMVLRIEQTAPA